MFMYLCRRTFVCSSVLLGLSSLAISNGWAQTVDLTPSVKQQVSIGDALSHDKDIPLHILYVHGIGAIGANDSEPLRKSICKFLKDCTNSPGVHVGRDYANQGQFALHASPPALKYWGSEIWQNQEEWDASAPFVDYWVLSRKGKKSIVVDEINWWPLVFKVKCRGLCRTKPSLRGPVRTISNCAPIVKPHLLIKRHATKTIRVASMPIHGWRSMRQPLSGPWVQRELGQTVQ